MIDEIRPSESEFAEAQRLITHYGIRDLLDLKRVLAVEDVAAFMARDTMAPALLILSAYHDGCSAWEAWWRLCTAVNAGFPSG